MLSSLRRPQPYPHKGRALLAIQANLAAHRSRGGGGGSVAERDLPNEVPELRYVEVEDQARLASMRFESSNWWGVQIPIALCVRCEALHGGPEQGRLWNPHTRLPGG